mgnify:CR=1 FL=1
MIIMLDLKFQVCKQHWYLIKDWKVEKMLKAVWDMFGLPLGWRFGRGHRSGTTAGDRRGAGPRIGVIFYVLEATGLDGRVGG